MSLINTAVKPFKDTACLGYNNHEPPFRLAAPLPASVGACGRASV